MSPSITARQPGGPDYLLVPSRRLQVVRSTRSSHFTGQLAKSASESESLTGLLSNRAIITRVGLQAVQALKYRVHLFATSGFTDSDLDKDTFLGAVDIDIGKYGLYVNGSESLDKFQDYIGAVPSLQTTSVGLSGGDNIWQAQGFRHTADYTLEQIKLRLSRGAGTSPGDMTVSIRKATDAGDPTGSDLVSAVVNVDSISDVAFTGELVTVSMTPTPIWARQKYSIVVRIPAGNSVLRWLIASGNPYSLGLRSQSLDAGVTWAADSDQDCYFEVHGRAGAPHYSLALPVNIPYEDRDATKKLHVVLENLDPTTKDAGANGEVVVELAYMPAS